MTVFAAPIITGNTLLKLIVGALVAGLGVSLSFSLLIYCAERASTLRREHRRGAGVAFQLAAAAAVLAVAALIAYGMVLTVSKQK